MTVEREFVENNCGVHLKSRDDEYTLCGSAYDPVLNGTFSELIPAKKRVVTCRMCVERVHLCRGIRTGIWKDVS